MSRPRGAAEGKLSSLLIMAPGLGGFVTVVDVVRIAYLQDAALERILELSGHIPIDSHSPFQKDFYC